jgi:hypothetical protein
MGEAVLKKLKQTKISGIAMRWNHYIKLKLIRI